MAAVTMPKFKVCWLKDEKRRDGVQTILISECRGQTPKGVLMRPPAQGPATSGHNDFFELEDEFSYTAETEVMEYLKLKINCEFHTLRFQHVMGIWHIPFSKT